MGGSGAAGGSAVWSAGAVWGVVLTGGGGKLWVRGVVVGGDAAGPADVASSLARLAEVASPVTRPGGAVRGEGA